MPEKPIILMNKGDLVFFKSLLILDLDYQNLLLSSYRCHQSIYSKVIFERGEKYQIVEVISWQNTPLGLKPLTAILKSLQDGNTFFTDARHWDAIVSLSEWRQLQVEKIIDF